jgi:starvation-inducible DNA-binding protein
MVGMTTSRFQSSPNSTAWQAARGTATFQATNADLVAALDELFRDNFNYYYKSAAFHWNTTGFDFPEFHGFFGDIYEMAQHEIDGLAEWLRRFDAQAPQMLPKVGQDGAVVTDFRAAVQILLADSEAYIAKLKAASLVANELNEQGALNYLATLMDCHQKLRWKYRSILVETAAAPAPAAEPAAPAEAPAAPTA